MLLQALRLKPLCRVLHTNQWLALQLGFNPSWGLHYCFIYCCVHSSTVHCSSASLAVQGQSAVQLAVQQPTCTVHGWTDLVYLIHGMIMIMHLRSSTAAAVVMIVQPLPVERFQKAISWSSIPGRGLTWSGYCHTL
jgi:hypothetical protein